MEMKWLIAGVVLLLGVVVVVVIALSAATSPSVEGRRLSTATPLPTAVGSSLIAAKMLSLSPTLVR